LEVIIDRDPGARAAGAEGGAAAAWVDADDEAVQVDLGSRDRLKKLRFAAEKDMLDGNEYTEALRSRYQANNELSWAHATEEGAHDSVLSRSGTMLRARARGSAGGPLPPGRIQMKRMMDANNKEPANGVVTGRCFDCIYLYIYTSKRVEFRLTHFHAFVHAYLSACSVSI
jgi:hypothetical protein